MGANERQYIRQCWKEDRARYPKHAAILERSIWAVAIFRFGQYGDAVNSKLIRLGYRLAYQPLSLLAEILTGISIPKSVVIGPGLRIYHSGGVVIHEKAVLGANCTLRHGITIGIRSENSGVPVIGDNVDIGACALILGGVSIGNNAKIGAGALVQIDVPENGIAYAPRAALVVGMSPSADQRVVSLVDDPAFTPSTPKMVPIAWSRPTADKNSHPVGE